MTHCRIRASSGHKVGEVAKEMLMCAFHMNCVAHQSQGLWRHPRDTSQQFNSMGYWQQLAKTLERGLFDGIFLADVSGVYDVYEGSPDAALRAAMQIPTNDPFTVVPVIAVTCQSNAITGTPALRESMTAHRRYTAW